MKKNISIVFYITLLIFSCSFKLSASSPFKCFCKPLQSTVKKNWKLSNDSTYYISKINDLNNIDSIYHDCLIKLTQRQVIKLFGKPTGTEQGRIPAPYTLQYKITPPCPSSNPFCGGGILYFNFDSAHKFKRAYIIWQAENRTIN